MSKNLFEDFMKEDINPNEIMNEFDDLGEFKTEEEKPKEIIQEVTETVKEPVVEEKPKRRGRKPISELKPDKDGILALIDLDKPINISLKDFVAKKTVMLMKESFKTEIYTEEYKKHLCDEYINNNECTLFFEELIKEAIDKEYEDEYLGSFTRILLEDIIDNSDQGVNLNESLDDSWTIG